MTSPEPEFFRTRGVLRWMLFLSLMLAALLGVALAVGGPLHTAFTQALLSLVALPAFRRLPVPTLTTLVALLASQASYLVLVWTDWRTHDVVWRLWWMASIAAATTTHLLALRTPAGFRGTRAERIARLGAAGSGLMLMALGLYPSVPANPGPVFYGLLAAPALASIIGSIVVWRERRGKTGEPRGPLRGWIRILLLTSTHVDRQLETDLAQLRVAVEGLEDLAAKSHAFQDALRRRREAENRTYFRPEEEEQIRAYFFTYLSHRSTLHRLIATYSSFQAVRDESVRARCFMTAFTAGAVAFEVSLVLIARYDGHEVIRKKLNEGDPSWGLESGMFDTIRAGVTSGDNIRMYLSMEEYHELHVPEWKERGFLPEETFGWMDTRLERAASYIATNPVSRPVGKVRNLLSRVKEDIHTPVIAAQSYISTWIGDTRIATDKPLITEAQVVELESRLQPGDILLERRNWYLSNAFLPGFWPHGALYVGRTEDLDRLGLLDHLISKFIFSNCR